MALVQEMNDDRVYLFSQSVRQLFIIGLQIHEAVSQEISDEELILMNRQHDELLAKLVISGFPLGRAVRMDYNNVFYLFTINHGMTTYQKIGDVDYFVSAVA